MQKSSTRSLSSKSLSVDDVNSKFPALFDTGRSDDSNKLTREDVSRCINIWAKMYHLSDEENQATDLCMPPRTWMGRSPDRLKRFE